jgi:hypothetical protein
LVYFVAIWYYMFPVLVCCTKNNLATPEHCGRFYLKLRLLQIGMNRY